MANDRNTQNDPPKIDIRPTNPNIDIVPKTENPDLPTLENPPPPPPADNSGGNGED